MGGADGLRPRWNHVTRLSCLTLALVLKLHGQSLEQLELCGPFDGPDVYIGSLQRISDGPEPYIGPLPRLRVLEISNADLGAFDAARKLLAWTRLTLNKVRLGQETSNALAWLFPHLHQRPNRTKFTRELWEELRHALQAEQETIKLGEEATDSGTIREAMNSSSKQMEVVLPAVDALHLIAIDAAVLLDIADKQPPIETQTIHSLDQRFIDIGQLQSLTLESCKVQGGWFDSLIACARAKGPLRLQVFALREERIKSAFPHKLDTFFGLFRGLKKVSLLLQGEDTRLPVKELISNHGETLKSLLIDQRRSARDSFGLTTHIRDPEDYEEESLLSLIGKGCPKLEQLGLSNSDPNDRWRHDQSLRTQFKNLRSMNLRVLPEQTSDVLSHRDCDDAHEKIAAHLIRLYHHFMPNLTLIGTGALTYQDIWLGRMNHKDNTNLERYLCPRYFYVQRLTNIRGEQQPVLTKIAQGTPTGIDEYSSHTDIFRPYWIV